MIVRSAILGATEVGRPTESRGDVDIARQLLQHALEMDPACEAVRLDLAELELKSGEYDLAREILTDLKETTKDRSRWDALNAHLQILVAAGGLNAVDLETQLADNPNDLEIRLRLANALTLNQEYRQALTHLLEIVRRDRKFQEDVGRKTMLTLFSLLLAQPEYDDLVREFRATLARTIN